MSGTFLPTWVRRLSSLRHPLSIAREQQRRAKTFLARHLRESQLQSVEIRRDSRDHCWCGGDLAAFEYHPSYGRCTSCGSYVNTKPPLQEELSELYSLDGYWRKRQKLKGIPPIERRGALYRRDGRLDAWIRLVEVYGPTAGRVIEIGCAPGVFLEALKHRGYDCIGVEISGPVAEWMRSSLRLDVRAGFFPGVNLPPCELFVSFDTLEHSPCPDRFVREAARLLVPGGIAIIQTAIERYSYDRPFGERFGDMFDDLEHLFLFTDEAMRRLASEAGLDIVTDDERIWVGGEIAVFRKPDGTRSANGTD